MSLRCRRLTHSFALGVLLLAASAGAETYWSTSYGKLLAFELDFDSGAARYVMQATGDPTDALIYFAVASEPGTGALLVFYIEPPQYRLALGRLRPGSFQPELVTLLPAIYGLASSAKFSPGGVLYAQLGDTLATLDTVTGSVAPILTFPAPGFLSGFGFDPVSGKLFLSGTESCDPVCTWFLDTLTVPQHQRERVLENTSYIAGDPLFDAAGEMLVMATNFYRIQGQTLVFFSDALRVPTPFGLGFMPLFSGSPATGTLGCLPSSSRGCLQNRRFAVEAIYDATAYGGTTGVAKPQLESDESLKFSFFSPENLELFVKVIDGCGYNGHYWFFASGLTSLSVTLLITDTVGGSVFIHNNNSGHVFVPVLEIQGTACGE
jgi:hypothetical protein